MPAYCDCQGYCLALYSLEKVFKYYKLSEYFRHAEFCFAFMNGTEEVAMNIHRVIFSSKTIVCNIFFTLKFTFMKCP